MSTHASKAGGGLFRAAFFGALAMALAAVALAGTPSPRIHYQGVLRDAEGHPISGSYEMEFHFYSAASGGDEIFVDSRHYMTMPGPVAVAGGLFSVTLGEGITADGSGPGVYTDLAQVFRDYGGTWLEIRIGGETLSPRVQVVASAYALNASNLGGKTAASFLDTGSTPQTKSGTLALFSGQPGFALDAAARDGGVRAYDSLGGAGLAEIGIRDFGLRVYGRAGGGNGMPGWFKDTQGTGEAWIAPGDDGLVAFGSSSAGVFRAGTPLSYTDEALLASGGFAFRGTGSFGGGEFHGGPGYDAATLASGGYGVAAQGDTAAGSFLNNWGYGTAVLASGTIGVEAYGSYAGGKFGDFFEDYGVIAAGKTGGHFTGWYLGYGISATGGAGAGEFVSGSGNARAYLARTPAGAGYGIDAEADHIVGYFRNNVYPSNTAIGWGDRGVWSEGGQYGGYFGRTNDPAALNYTYLANGWGVQGVGTYYSGFGAATFKDRYYSGHAQLGRGDAGIVSYATLLPGVFRLGSEAGWTTWTHISEGSSSINGNGAKNFIQNHPYDPDAEIVYTALEGDEVGTYTRGSAVLEGGVARVKLSPSFAWVTNPDVGLTATVTPRGVPVALAVESVSTSELVVRAEPGAHDLSFDYVVHGLRLGFESFSVVRPRRSDAPIPPMSEHAKVYAARPEMRQYNAMERFAAMQNPSRAGGVAIDLARSEALVAAVGIGDEMRQPVRRSLLTPEHGAQWEQEHPGASLLGMEAAAGVHPPEEGPRALERTEAQRPARAGGAERSAALGPPGVAAAATVTPSARPLVPTLPVAEEVEAGDVLVNDWARPGSFVRAREAGDRGVIGIVVGEPGQRFSTDAPVALAGMVVRCKVDANEAPIEVNDLLMASSLAGHAAPAGPAPRQGTVIGKALEPLSAGTGVIQVLVMNR